MEPVSLSISIQLTVTSWPTDPFCVPGAAPSINGSSTQKCFLVAGQDPKKGTLFHWKRQRYWAWLEGRCVTQENLGEMSRKTGKIMGWRVQRCDGEMLLAGAGCDCRAHCSVTAVPLLTWPVQMHEVTM